jgi:hypothetical protein
MTSKSILLAKFDVNAPIVFGVLFNYKISNLLILYEEVAVTVSKFILRSH